MHARTHGMQYRGNFAAFPRRGVRGGHRWIGNGGGSRKPIDRIGVNSRIRKRCDANVAEMNSRGGRKWCRALNQFSLPSCHHYQIVRLLTSRPLSLEPNCYCFPMIQLFPRPAGNQAVALSLFVDAFQLLLILRSASAALLSEVTYLVIWKSEVDENVCLQSFESWIRWRVHEVSGDSSNCDSEDFQCICLGVESENFLKSGLKNYLADRKQWYEVMFIIS